MTTFTDEIRETVSPHKFGGDRRAAMLWLLMLESGQDDETGDAQEWSYWVGRFGRRLLYTYDSGAVEARLCASELEAVRELEAEAEAYGTTIEAREEEAQAWSDGYRPAGSVQIDAPIAGAVVSVEGMQGVAFRVEGLPTRRLSDYTWSGIEWVHPGRRLVHMVGDDRTFDYPADIMLELGDDDYCATCGQIGCGWC